MIGLVGACNNNPKTAATDGLVIDALALPLLCPEYDDRSVVLISDTMRAAGMSDGEYDLGGQNVIVKGPLATLADGTIAGSVTDLMACMVRAVSFGIPLADAVRAAAVNPAQAIGIFDRVGTLDPGKRANAAVLGPDLELKAVFFHGELV